MATSDNLAPDIYQFLETIALHGGTAPDPTTGAMLTPIYQTTTYSSLPSASTRVTPIAVRAIRP